MDRRSEGHWMNKAWSWEIISWLGFSLLLDNIWHANYWEKESTRQELIVVTRIKRVVNVQQREPPPWQSRSTWEPPTIWDLFQGLNKDQNFDLNIRQGWAPKHLLLNQKYAGLAQRDGQHAKLHIETEKHSVDASTEDDTSPWTGLHGFKTCGGLLGAAGRLQCLRGRK